MSYSPLRVGVMGCSSFAKRTMIPCLLASEKAHLTAVASRSAQKAENFAASFHCDSEGSYEALLQRDDIDAVYMPLPGGIHEEWIDKTLEAGKHILVEKPFAVDFEVAKRLLKKAKDKNLCVMENYVFPFHRQAQRMKEILAEGTLGRILLVRISFAFPPLKDDNFRYNKALGGGAILDAGGYILKAAQYFLGCDLTILGSYLEFSDSLGIDMAGGVFMKSSEDVLIQGYFGFDSYYQCLVEILGTQGKLSAPRFFTAPPTLAPSLFYERQNFKSEEVVLPDNQYKNHWDYFAEVIQSGDLKQFQENYQEIECQSKLTNAFRVSAEMKS